MSLIYFEIEHGTLALDRSRITGCKENRLPSSYPTRVLVDHAPGHYDVRNGFDDVQRRLMAAPCANPEG